jgi:tetratricopeptide (TPR) repeat protein
MLMGLGNLILAALLPLSTVDSLPPQAPPSNPAGIGTAADANALRKQFRFSEAAAIYKRLLIVNPDDPKLNFDCALTLYLQASNEDDAAKAQELGRQARVYALKAKSLGCEEPLNESVLSLVHEDGTITKNTSMDPDKAVDAILQKAEQAFSKGDMQEALKNYQAALALNPKNYAATLYSGDVYFSWKDYGQAVVWYERAIALNPDVETAYRYCGDALSFLGKHDEALGKYLAAVLTEPRNKLAWSGLKNYASDLNREVQKSPLTLPKVSTETKGGNVSIVADLKSGTLSQGYALARTQWIKDHPVAAGGTYRHSLAEEASAIRMTIRLADDLKGAGPEDPFAKSCATLKAMDSEGLLEPFILLDAADSGIAEDYKDFLQQHRGLLVRYIRKYRLDLP